MQRRTIHTERKLSQLTGAEFGFETLLSHVAAHSSKVLAVEERAVRERLQVFREDFERSYEATVRRHIGDANMPALIEALDSPAMRRFIHASREMRPTLEVQLGELSKRMGETPI